MQLAEESDEEEEEEEDDDDEDSEDEDGEKPKKKAKKEPKSRLTQEMAMRDKDIVINKRIKDMGEVGPGSPRH